MVYGCACLTQVCSDYSCPVKVQECKDVDKTENVCRDEKDGQNCVKKCAAPVWSKGKGFSIVIGRKMA